MGTINLGKVETRNRLAPRRDPYWQRIEAGCFLGYRKMTANSAGAWLARSRDATAGKQIQSPLGEFSDHPAHARFDIAQIDRAHGGLAAEYEKSMKIILGL